MEEDLYFEDNIVVGSQDDYQDDDEDTDTDIDDDDGEEFE